MSQSINTTNEGTDQPRWRLIPHHGNPSMIIRGTQAQADESGRILSALYGGKVLVTELPNDGIPTNHHSVGTKRPTVTPNPQGEAMSSTSMAPEPRVKNGEKPDVEEAIEKSQVLTQSQKDELAAKRAEVAANGGTKKTSTSKAKKTTTPKAPKEPKVKKIGKVQLGQELTKIRATLRELPEENHEESTAVRKELSTSWKCAAANDFEGYVSSVKTARGLAQKAKLTDTVKAMDAALKVAAEALKQQEA